MSANATLGQYPTYVQAADILGVARFSVSETVQDMKAIRDAESRIAAETASVLREYDHLSA